VLVTLTVNVPQPKRAGTDRAWDLTIQGKPQTRVTAHREGTAKTTFAPGTRTCSTAAATRHTTQTNFPQNQESCRNTTGTQHVHARGTAHTRRRQEDRALNDFTPNAPGHAPQQGSQGAHRGKEVQYPKHQRDHTRHSAPGTVPRQKVATWETFRSASRQKNTKPLERRENRSVQTHAERTTRTG
jgi:hypothetical protein